MRGLFWNKIADKAVDKTQWKGLTDEGVKLDVAALEALFCADDPNKGKAGGEVKKAGGGGKKKKAGPVMLLDGKRQQNAGIALARMKMKPKEVRAAVLAGESRTLGDSRVGILLNLVPTPEEVAMLSEYEGDRGGLGLVEKAFVAVMDISHYENRLKCMAFELKLEGLLGEASEKEARTRRALDAITESTAFKGVLQFVLALGNHLNGGTSRGAAYGFKVDVLKKMDGVKSFDNKVTLLQWVVGRARRNAGDPAAPFLRIPADFAPIAPAASESLEQLVTDVKGLETNLALVKSTVESVSSGGGGAGDTFPTAFGAFLEAKEHSITKLGARITAVQTRFKQVAKDFGEDPKKTDTLKFFPLFSGFASAVAGAIEADKAAAERERKEAAKASKKKGGAAPKDTPKSPGKGGDSLVDSKFSTLTSNAAGGMAGLMGEMKKRQARRAAGGGGRRRSMMPGAKIVLPKAK